MSEKEQPVGPDEITRKAEVYMTDLKCKKCGKGVMNFTGLQRKGVQKVVTPGMPPRQSMIFLHRCDNAECKAEAEVTNMQYPKINFRPIDEIR